MKTHIVILTTLTFVCFSNQGKAQGNLVFNGGFDSNAVGWTLSNGSSFISTFGNPSGSVRLGNASPSPSLIPSASQTVGGLVPGLLYTVSGDYLVQGKEFPPDYSFGVAVDGVFLFQAAAPTDYDWYSFNFLYTASSSSAVLSLSAQLNGTGIPYIIDNTSMQAVPEPSSFCLMGVASLASAVLFKRRRKGSS